MDIQSLAISMISMGSLGAIFSIGLAVANKKLHVEEDPLVLKLLDLLPGANCGGCGYPGCSNFAENVVAGKCKVTDCPVSDEENVLKMAAALGVEAEKSEALYPVVHCQGNTENAHQHAVYLGIPSCIGAKVNGGADKDCEYGCYGFGDCVEACTFDALHMSLDGLPVLDESCCSGCGQCVDACPQQLIELHPKSHRVFVLCKNLDNPKTARKVCSAACFGCTICARKTENEAITMIDNLAIVHHDRLNNIDSVPFDKCKTGALTLRK